MIIPQIVADASARLQKIKHDVHGLKPSRAADGTVQDAEGTDSWRLKQAGADKVILCGPEGPDLDTALGEAFPAQQGKKDLILVEGYKNADIPKIGICRKANGKGFTAPAAGFIAVVTDLDKTELPPGIPVFGPDDIMQLTGFIETYYERFYAF